MRLCVRIHVNDSIAWFSSESFVQIACHNVWRLDVPGKGALGGGGGGGDDFSFVFPGSEGEVSCSKQISLNNQTKRPERALTIHLALFYRVVC